MGFIAGQPGHFGHRGGHGFHVSGAALLVERAEIARMGAFSCRSLATDGVTSKCHARGQQRSTWPPVRCFQAIRGTANKGGCSRPANSIKVMCSSFNSTVMRSSGRQRSGAVAVAGTSCGLEASREGPWHRLCRELNLASSESPASVRRRLPCFEA